MQIYGYIRVSTEQQHDDRQRAALAPFNIPEANIFADKQSGKDFERPEYKRMLSIVNAGDMLYIKSIDRLGRNYVEIIEEWKMLTRDKKIDIKVLDMPLLDTTCHKDLLGTFISDLVLQVLSFSAEQERSNILQRQSEGIAAAKRRGVKFGRKPIPLPENFESIYYSWLSGAITSAHAAELCNFSRRTWYMRLEQMQLGKPINIIDK